VSINVITGRRETLGELHQPHRLAIALRLRHAEVASAPSPFTLRPFSWPITITGISSRRAMTAHDRVVVGELAVTVQFVEIREHMRSI
jgi:hypothetical protein